MEATDRIHTLLTRYRNKTITPAEFDELLIWMSGLNNEQSVQLSERHSDLWEAAKAGKLHSTGESVNSDAMLREVMESDRRTVSKPAMRLWLRIAAAAAIVVVIAGIYLLYVPAKEAPVPTASTQKTFQTDEILPIVNQTVLTLPDGRTIILDSATSGARLTSTTSIVVKVQDGEIAYRKPVDDAAPEYHTVSVPRGGRPYRVLLEDGSSVWLNAASSLRYPSFFNGAHRSVELTGEGYFDIEHRVDTTSGNTRRNVPFIVRLPRMDVEVLGTQFNIMAYDDEGSIQATLLRGSVKVSGGNEEKLLTPGKQARLSTNGQLSVVTANTEMTTAWVNGYFQFDKADVATILRQVGRWYDLDIEYRGKVPQDLFSGKIERTLPLSGILKLLASGQIRMEISGKKLIVL